MAVAALIVVDVQKDFCPGGALAVPDGDLIVSILNRYIRRFSEKARPIFASRDWHPVRTRHFRDYGGLWPIHCVQGTNGAAFHDGIELTPDATIISKGEDPHSDAYSAFQATTPEGISLAGALESRGVDRVYVGGLATDYCVKSTVLDALKRGLEASLLIDASRGVNLKPHDSELAIEEMVRAGASVATFEHVRL